MKVSPSLLHTSRHLYSTFLYASNAIADGITGLLWPCCSMYITSNSFITQTTPFHYAQNYFSVTEIDRSFTDSSVHTLATVFNRWPSYLLLQWAARKSSHPWSQSVNWHNYSFRVTFISNIQIVVQTFSQRFFSDIIQLNYNRVSTFHSEYIFNNRPLFVNGN